MSPEELANHLTIDLTTTGRRSGRPSRIEIWWFRIDGRFVITGTPGPRDWFANVLADPRVTVHVAGMDLPGTARPVTDPAFRRRVMTDPMTFWYSTQARLEHLVADAPMVTVELDQPDA